MLEFLLEFYNKNSRIILPMINNGLIVKHKIQKMEVWKNGRRQI